MKRDPREPKNISLDEGGHGVVMPAGECVLQAIVAQLAGIMAG